jgi:CRISPR-associated protein GSU0053/csb1, Dpsyc system
MTSKLKDEVRRNVLDSNTAGLAIEAEYEPLGGSSTPIAPASYAPVKGSSADDKSPTFAVSENAFMPVKTTGGWYSGIERKDGEPRFVSRVAIDSVGSQSGRAETALWESQEDLGISFPGLIITGEASDSKESSFLQKQIDDALSITVTSWTASHRQADAWARFAVDEDSKQVWQNDAEGSVKSIITTTSADTGEKLYEYFPNSAIYGFWLSSGTAMRHRLPRAYSSEIVGYGAIPVKTGSTKLDVAGGASEKSRLTFGKDGALAARSTAKDKPSVHGFGSVPSSPMITGYVCELILQQSSVSLSVLRSLKFEDSDVKTAALTVLTLLAMAGHALANTDGFLRSGCALVQINRQWGWVRHGQVEPEKLEVTDTEQIIEALREAIEDAAKLGLEFAPPINLKFSPAQRTLIEDRVRTEMSKQGQDNE